MSSFNILKSACVVIFGAALGYGSVRYVQTENSPSRFLASTAVSKMATEQFARTVLEVRVGDNEISQSQNETSILKIRVKALKPITGGLNYSWNLPEGVQVAKGSSSGILPDMTADEIQEFSLTVTGFSKQQKNFVSFEVSGQFNSLKLKREVLLSSRPEDSFEYVVQQHEKARRAEAKQNSKVGKASVSKPLVDPKNIIR